MSIWDDPELKMNDDFVKLENVGDTVSGTIQSIRPHRFDDGSVAVQIIFIDDRDGGERTWSAGQVQAKKRLAEIRPEVGWKFRARLDSIEKRAGGKTLKHIDVQAKPGDTAPPPQVHTGATPPSNVTAAGPPHPGPTTRGGSCPPGIEPDTWAVMTPAQQQQMRQALGLTTDQPAGPPPASSPSFFDEPPF